MQLRSCIWQQIKTKNSIQQQFFFKWNCGYLLILRGLERSAQQQSSWKFVISNLPSKLLGGEWFSCLLLSPRVITTACKCVTLWKTIYERLHGNMKPLKIPVTLFTQMFFQSPYSVIWGQNKVYRHFQTKTQLSSYIINKHLNILKNFNKVTWSQICTGFILSYGDNGATFRIHCTGEENVLLILQQTNSLSMWSVFMKNSKMQHKNIYLKILKNWENWMEPQTDREMCLVGRMSYLLIHLYIITCSSSLWTSWSTFLSLCPSCLCRIWNATFAKCTYTNFFRVICGRGSFAISTSNTEWAM